MNGFTLKLIAMITMFIDHSTYLLMDLGVFVELPWLYSLMRSIGRIALPLFCFLLANGYRYTKNPARYLGRLLLFGLIAQPFFAMMFHQVQTVTQLFQHFNTLFTLSAGLLLLWMLDLTRQCCITKERAPTPFLLLWIPLVVILFTMATGRLETDYGLSGVVLILLFSLVSQTHPAFSSLVSLGWGFYQYHNLPVSYGIGATAAIFPIFLYNGKQGPRCKWLFYSFYPAHIALLWVIRILFTS